MYLRELYDEYSPISWRENFVKYILKTGFDQIQLYTNMRIFETMLPADIVNFIFTKIACFTLKDILNDDKKKLYVNTLNYVIKWSRTDLHKYNLFTVCYESIFNTIMNSSELFIIIREVDLTNSVQITQFGDLFLGISLESYDNIESCHLLFNNEQIKTPFIFNKKNNIINLISYYYNEELPVIPVIQSGFTTWKLQFKFKTKNENKKENKKENETKLKLIYLSNRDLYLNRDSFGWINIYKENKLIFQDGCVGYFS
jgi:hypothetical protein